MSELLTRTVERALPLFARRWENEVWESGIRERFDPAREDAPWSLLVDAVRSGTYRPAAAAIRRASAHTDEPRTVVRAQLSLLAECVRIVYDGDARDLPTLLRELDAVQEILLSAMDRGEETEREAPRPPIIEALDRAAGIVPFVTTTYEPGQAIATREERDPILYCIRRGRVRLTGPLPDGRMVLLSILREGDVFGVADATTRRRTSALAMTHSEVTLLHGGALPALTRIAPAVVTTIIASLMAQLHDAHLLIEHVLAHDTSVRLVTLLRTLADAFGEPAREGKTLITHPATHQDLADMIGANRVTVTRKLLELQKAGLIIPERRNMMRVDLPGLAALLNDGL
jgi:CRP/FNR family cyclic AMP-dependent transcriptional regulator